MLFYVGLKTKKPSFNIKCYVLAKCFGQGCSMKIYLYKKNPLAKYRQFKIN